MGEQQEDLFFVDEEIPTWQIARALGWDPRKARRAFETAGVAHRVLGSFGWYVLRSDLVRLMPEVERQWRELRDRGLLKMPGRARPGNRNATNRTAPAQ